MLTRELLSQTLPSLRLHDKVYQALLWMNENHVTHLPIVEDDKYVALISEDDLLFHDEKASEPSLAYLLSRMVYPRFPECLGVFRCVEQLQLPE